MPAVYSNALVTSPDGHLLGRFGDDSRPFNANELLAHGNFLNHSSMLYRASSARRLLALSAPFIDYGMHLSLAQDGLLVQLSPCFVVYRAGTSTSMLKTMPEHVRDMYFSAMLEALPRTDRRTSVRAAVRYLSLFADVDRCWRAGSALRLSYARTSARQRHRRSAHVDCNRCKRGAARCQGVADPACLTARPGGPIADYSPEAVRLLPTRFRQQSPPAHDIRQDHASEEQIPNDALSHPHRREQKANERKTAMSVEEAGHQQPLASGKRTAVDAAESSQSD